jgi:hypothetical protein
MAKQLPFDVFINRKIQKWEHRAKERGIDLIDAIGVSPIEEMIYFWAGHKRMQPQHLEQSLANLDWSLSNDTFKWQDEPLDEQSIRSLIRATALRYLGKPEEARELLQQDILSHNWSEFKGNLRDSWPSPCARYEMACSFWQQRDSSEENTARLKECSQYLEELASWESYDLDARYDYLYALLL